MTKTIKDVRAFISDFESQGVQICVEEPETVTEKGMFSNKEYTTFLIMTKKVGRDPVGVRHRYSEFETFRTSMRQRWGPYGIIVPQLPGKRVIGKGEWNFVIERMFGLSLFCEAFVENPFLVSDMGWAQFSFPAEYSPGLENPAEAALKSALPHLPVPDAPRDRMSSLEEETTVVEYYTKLCFEKFKAVQSTAKSHAAALTDLNVDLEKWSTEEDYLVAFGGRGIDTLGVRLPENEKPVKSVGAVKALYAREEKQSLRKPQLLGIFECAIMEHLIGMVEGLKELFKSHTTLTGEIDTLKNKIHKLELTRQPTPKTDEAIMESKAKLEIKEANLSNFYKSFFHFSLPLFARRRAAMLKRLTLCMGANNMVAGAALEKSAKMMFEEMNYSSESALNFTNVLLQKLSSEPLDALEGNYEHVSGDSTVPQQPFTGLFERAVAPTKAAELDAAAETASRGGNGDVFKWKQDNLPPATAPASDTPAPPMPPSAPPVPAAEEGEFM